MARPLPFGSLLLGLGRRQLADQPQRRRQALELVVRTQEELRGVVARIALDLVDDESDRIPQLLDEFADELEELGASPLKGF